MPQIQDLPEDIKDLALHNALEISDSRWDYDVKRLIDALNKEHSSTPIEMEQDVDNAPTGKQRRIKAYKSKAIWIAFVIIIGLLGGIVALKPIFYPKKPDSSVFINNLQDRMPKKFDFIYNFGDDRERGKHEWKRINENAWIERFPNGDENTIHVIGPITIEGDSGTLLQLAHDSSIEYFIPNLGSQTMRIRIRTEGEWRPLGEMQGYQ